MLPVALVIIIGMLCRSSGKLTREAVNTLKSVAVDIALPAVVVGTFASAEYNLRSVIVPLIMFGLCTAAWALGKLAAKVFGMKSRFVPLLTTGFEGGMIGYTFYPMLYGSENLSSFAVVDLGQSLFVFTLYKVFISSASGSKTNTKTIVRDILTSPIIIGIACGVILGVSGIYKALIPCGVSGVLDSCVSFISAPTSVLILLSIGYDFAPREIRWGEVCSVVVLRLAIMAALACGAIFLVQTLFGKDIMILRAFVLMAMMPPPFVLPIFSDEPEQRSFIASTLSVSTLATIIGFSVLAALG